MEFGFEAWVTDYSMDVRELAQEVEALGFESLWIPEHTHVPIRARSKHPGRAPTTRDHAHAFDIFVACGVAAAVTTTLKIGTGICIAPVHDPIHLARATATIDHLSGGRFLFGIGAGWNLEELANHGVETSSRFRLMREQVEAVRHIWTSEVAEYHGRHVDFAPLQSWPKPVQDPHPPVLIGGMGPRVLERVLAYGDGWIMMPFNGAYTSRDLGRVVELRERAERAGLPRPSVSAITTVMPDLEAIERLESYGVERTIFLVRSLREATVNEPDGSTADVQRAVLARCGALVAEWRGRVGT